MTISLAWIRRTGGVEELVVATDSRLSFGCRWDCCPKLRALPRNDSVIAFAGDTMYAYPIMLQVISAISQHQRLLSRAMDLQDLKGHLLRILNNMTSLVHDLPPGVPNEPDTTFILCGWSWKKARFLAWLLHFDANIKRFTFRPASAWSGPRANKNKYLVFTGDYKKEFYERLVKLLRSKKKLQSGGFDMEPLEVLRDMLRSGQYDKIGGAPQLIKVYKHMNCRPYGIFWPTAGDKKVNLLGRPLLDYEMSEFLILDPDTLATTKHIDVA
jgi:hypothetical protein